MPIAGYARDAQRARDTFDISIEASVRRLVDLRPETLAAIWYQSGRIRYHHKGTGFPWINRNPRSEIAQTTTSSRAVSNGRPVFIDATEAHPMAWADTPDLTLCERTGAAMMATP